jgi:putative NADH-flavin reductase
MRVVVFGASGGIGRQLVEQGVAAGHDVVAVKRASSAVTFADRPNLEVVEADVMQPAEVEPIVRGADAVLSAVGPRDGRAPSTVCRDSAASILTAMAASGVQRFEAVSGSGPYPEGSGVVMRAAKPMARRFLRHTFDDMVAMDDELAHSDVEWTSVRPPRLTDKAGTGRYRTSRDHDLRFAVTVARADVAHYMLSILDDRSTYRAACYVAN